VEKSAKSPSSQLRAGQSIAETASRNTGNPGSDLIKFFSFLEFYLQVLFLHVQLRADRLFILFDLMGVWQYRGEKQRNVPNAKDSLRSFMIATQMFSERAGLERLRDHFGKVFLSSIDAFACRHI